MPTEESLSLVVHFLGRRPSLTSSPSSAASSVRLPSQPPSTASLDPAAPPTLSAFSTLSLVTLASAAIALASPPSSSPSPTTASQVTPRVEAIGEAAEGAVEDLGTGREERDRVGRARFLSEEKF